MQAHPFGGGWLEVVVGPMFSGKSEELIRRVTRALIARQAVQVFKPAIDDRYDAIAVASHAGRTLEAEAVDGTDDLRSRLRDGTEVVAIDEAQFFDDGLVELVQDLADDLPRIDAFGSELNQVWTNLITNAVQAMNDRGDLELRTSVPRPGWVRVEVEDHGRGIPPEAAEHLFEARFTTRGGRVEFGLGLGLPISRSIVRRHGGEISFTSEPGRTVFAVDLPRHPPPSSDHPNDPSP